MWSVIPLASCRLAPRCITIKSLHSRCAFCGLSILLTPCACLSPHAKAIIGFPPFLLSSQDTPSLSFCVSFLCISGPSSRFYALRILTLPFVLLSSIPLLVCPRLRFLSFMTRVFRLSFRVSLSFFLDSLLFRSSLALHVCLISTREVFSAELPPGR